MQEIISGASPETQQALTDILALEREHLPQKNPNASKLARDIAGIISKVVR